MPTVINLPNSPTMSINGNVTDVTISDWANIVLSSAEATEYISAEAERNSALTAFYSNNSIVFMTNINYSANSVPVTLPSYEASIHVTDLHTYKPGFIYANNTVTHFGNIEMPSFPTWESYWNRFLADTANVTFPSGWYTVTNT